MLTTMSWVPLGAMRKVPLKASIAAEEAKAALRERHGADVEEEDAVVDSDASDNGEDAVYNIGQGNILDQVESDDESELEDITYKDTDLVFAAARASDDPHFEVYTYDEPKDHLFLHHDVPLAAFPLCSTWLSDGESSLLAVGTMQPYVEIWTLDVMDPVTPALVLGGCEQPAQNYKRRIRPEWLKEDSHTDAIVAMQWNRHEQQYLVTGGADSMIKIWDLSEGACIGTYRENARVNGTEWHPEEANLLLACCGEELTIRDCRQPDVPAARWNTAGDVVENVQWDLRSGCVFASTEQGRICAFEARMGGQKMWDVSAHGAETVIAVSPHAPILASSGKDGQVALWDIRSTPETPIVSRDLKIGQGFSLRFHPNCPTILGGVGAAGLPLIYTIQEDVGKVGITFGG